MPSHDPNSLGPTTFASVYLACEKGARELLTTLGYVVVPAVRISSGVDPSVRFIGSHISVLKPHVIDPETLPSPGLAMLQQCVRTRNLQTCLTGEGVPNWGSTFPSLGILAPYVRLADVVNDARRCLMEVFEVTPADTMLRVSARDPDLLEIARAWEGGSLEIDTQSERYYQHFIGISDVSGRSFNIAIRLAGSDHFDDVGNIIVLQKKDCEAVVEVALGVTTILRQTSGSKHILDFSPAHGLFDGPEPIVRRLEDAIATTIVLFRDGVRPRADNRGRLLRVYLLSLALNAARLRLSPDRLGAAIKEAAGREPYLADVLVAEEICGSLDRLRTRLSNGVMLNDQEKKVAAELEASG